MANRYTGLVAALLICAASASHAINGTYDMSNAACAAQVSDGRMTISGNMIQFWESRCQLTNATNLRDMPQARLYDMLCSGEGMTWSNRVFIGSNGSNGLVMYSRGFGRSYVRCR